MAENINSLIGFVFKYFLKINHEEDSIYVFSQKVTRIDGTHFGFIIIFLS